MQQTPHTHKYTTDRFKKKGKCQTQEHKILFFFVRLTTYTHCKKNEENLHTREYYCSYSKKNEIARTRVINRKKNRASERERNKSFIDMYDVVDPMDHY